ncbi:NUDIX hydrolase [Alkalihalobacillus alcalophilus ATCC 27647 = CGMCC 1.3604]|uniref:NUDIX hydrolase n=1 Tax=Alkalihalobacillus alcalophilus ATCC 27647 = CGMCC 1.3604 TaxID=1218173 RepID=A0A094XGT7_ALKAL|nr:CoA pyrophosphatase [Alkalihalobacillus alcalophilus]KGA98005.1 NUDIX hydrolase [Alkalihalobacillus alcalophilus ATCC 27647 = CGMCC 1.3604]MED1561873.1 CoA pyrophosphatase [Alkalihalobacillus alcalophilus]THG90454.1 NUDIX hydrolase [Alkalihalobacillus alcalophilus ATCC 27647 = CGMCC 1.3604]
MSKTNINTIIKKLHSRKANMLGHDTSKHSAVLLPLVQTKEGISVLFEVRALTLNSQPGEICFPGGRIDATDQTNEEAALRELKEEIGIPPSEIKMISSLDYIVSPNRGIIYPFVAQLNSLTTLHLNKEEVDHIFTIPLDYLYSYQAQSYELTMKMVPDSRFPFEKIADKDAYVNRTQTHTEYFYFYKDYVIWGLTAKILKHFLDLTR